MRSEPRTGSPEVTRFYSHNRMSRVIYGTAIGVCIAVLAAGAIMAVQETQGRMISDVYQVVTAEQTEPLPEELRGETLGKFEITYYDLNCDTCETDSICANGEEGIPYVTLAASPDIPLGTRLKLIYHDGSYRIGVVMDRGGAIKGNRIDVLVETHQEALELGRDVAEVVIID